jgi:hypothetical protein
VPEARRRPEEVAATDTTSSDVRRWWVPRRCGGGNRSEHERVSVMWVCRAKRGRVPVGLSSLTFVGHPYLPLADGN